MANNEEVKWSGIDDDLAEKQPGSGAIYDAETGEWLFRVPPEYRPLIVRAVNNHKPLVEALRELLESGVESDDPRMSYITMQAEKNAIRNARAALALATGETK